MLFGKIPLRDGMQFGRFNLCFFFFLAFNYDAPFFTHTSDTRGAGFEVRRYA